MAFAALRGAGVRAPELPLVGGILFGQPLPDPVAAHELSAAWRHHREPYAGVTTDGVPERGLRPLAETGISAAVAVDAAREFVNLLPANERAVAQLTADSDDRRLWTNAFPMWLLPAHSDRVDSSWVTTSTSTVCSRGPNSFSLPCFPQGEPLLAADLPAELASPFTGRRLTGAAGTTSCCPTRASAAPT